MLSYTEQDSPENYEFTVSYSDTADTKYARCPECCIGGSRISTAHVFDNQTHLRCRKHARLYYCRSDDFDVIAFPCSEKKEHLDKQVVIQRNGVMVPTSTTNRSNQSSTTTSAHNHQLVSMAMSSEPSLASASAAHSLASSNVYMICFIVACIFTFMYRSK
ncbi:uncharacterized protein BYT42DRAFT_566174 [Radiomyces spectabilis]|uniref:uncharacterized protein n=1 Tax=Radiomyces spectabilis TaxID=64574 RepID=UPI00221FFD60|nr:uncharacterized protein BYT42DRAFT_566174 [Radiomyces spectabilis]KAI8381338.1 hypothetical protein BYT42DRAFT_566174 [Radiomyces spectabilis]